MIRLRGDKETSFGAIVQVLDELSLNGLTRVAIVTDRRDLAPAKNTSAATHAQETNTLKP